MEAVVGLLLVLMGVSHAVETSCDGRQDGVQCDGALGGAVNIQLVDDTSERSRFQWKKNDSFIIQWRNKTNIAKPEEKNKSLFIPSNGTVRINNLNRNDGGEYKLEIFDSDGRQTGTRTLNLSLHSPVSSVQLVSECLSQGQMMSCSSEGDSPQYSWTLDGHTLTDSELLSGNDQTNVIVLRQNISGRLVCSVRNKVSQSSSQEDISTCGFIFINCTSNGTLISQWVLEKNNTLCVEPTSVPTTEAGLSPLLILGLRAALVILPLIGISLYFTWKKKKVENSKTSEDPENSVMMVDMTN